MANIGKLFAASGLVLMTGPLSLTLQAQDYIDLEAERAGAGNTSSPTVMPSSSSSATPGDPYGVQPAQSYPATSYGLNRAPAAAAPTAGATGAPAPAGSSGNQNMGTLFLQVQQLRQEVMRLNGQVEEQANELRKLKSQSLERYVDLDKRLSEAGGVAPAPDASSGRNSGSSTASSPSGQGASSPGETEAYRSAYALVRSQQFDQAISAFNAFLRTYPDGRFAPNAHYWLGELYLVIDPPDLEASRQSFTLLLSEYPDNAKAPDAMYKLGKVQFLKGNREKSREYLEQVVRDYGNTNSAAVKLSRDFLAENF